MPSKLRLGAIHDSLLSDSVDGTHTAADENESVGAASDAQSDTQSDASLPRSALEMKEDNLSCAQNTDSEEKSTQNGEMMKRVRRKRARHSRSHRNESDDEIERKDEDMDVDHKAMLSSADRKIQVGDDFQAQVDETQKVKQEAESSEDDRDQVMWRPPGDLDEAKLMEFCEDAIGVYKLSYDRTLYILQKSNFDFETAREKVKRRRLVSEEWSEDERILFKQAFHMFGKRFDKIRQTMPYRSMASIIQFYYNTKKDIDYKSLLDSRIADDSEDDKSNDELDYEEGRCDNCGEGSRTLHPIDEVKLCYVCRIYYKLMRKHRPCTYASTLNENRQRKARKCPEDMHDIAQTFFEMSKHVDDKPCSSDDNISEGTESVETPRTRCHEETKVVMRELARARSRVVRLESTLKAQRAADGLMDAMDEYRSLAAKEDKKDDEGSTRRDRVRGSHTWTEEERVIAFHCLVRYRRDFDAVAEILGTKTSDKVKSFYTEMKEDIDKLLEKEAELEAEIARSFNIEKELNIEPPKTVEVVNLE